MKNIALLILIFSLSAGTALAQEEADDNSKPESEAQKALKTAKDKEATPKKKKPSKIYTWIDKKGNRIYSDNPREGAEELKIQKQTEYTPTKVENPWATTPKVVDEKNIAYTYFAVASPSPDATIRNNQGSIQVAFDVRPKLQPGHEIILLRNGTEAGRSKTPLISLNNIDRGSHALSGQIVTANGDVLISSDSVTVHLHRPTIRRAP